MSLTLVRAERQFVHIGKGTNVRDNVIIHTSLIDGFSIGDRASIGHRCIVQGSTVGSNFLIVIGAVVTQGTVIPAGSLVMGSSAKVKRPLSAKKIEGLAANCNAWLRLSRNQLEEIL